MEVEIEPDAIKDAKETRKIMAIELMDKVSVRGRETFITPTMRARLNLGEKRGKRPAFSTNGTCTRTCKLAPITTPTATPIMPKRVARKIMPTIIPALYKSGARA